MGFNVSRSGPKDDHVQRVVHINALDLRGKFSYIITIMSAWKMCVVDREGDVF